MRVSERNIVRHKMSDVNMRRTKLYFAWIGVGEPSEVRLANLRLEVIPKLARFR